MNTYLEQFNNQNENNHDFFEQLRNYAEKHNVPIIKRDSLVLIQGLLNIIDAKDMLEIGTAIGYSALSLVSSKLDLHVDTIERNELMYQEATKNVQILNKQDQVNIIFGDSLEFDKNNYITINNKIYIIIV